jgi:virginiamycin B lyase
MATSGSASSQAGRSAGITPKGVITEFQIRRPTAGREALAAGPDGNVWFSEFNASKIGRITPDGKITEFEMPRPNSGPGDITAGADGNMWFLELNGQMDGRKSTATASAESRWTENHRVPDSQCDRLADKHRRRAGSKHLVHEGRRCREGDADGAITEVPMPPNSGGTGLTAGSDRQPPRRISNRLWVASSGGNKLLFLTFK